MTQAIRDQVNQLLQENNIVFDAIFLGKTQRENWSCFAWKVHFSNGKKSESFDYFTGLGCVEKLGGVKKQKLIMQFGNGLTRSDEKKNNTLWCNFLHWVEKNEFLKPEKPHAAGILHSLCMDATAENEGFEDWCSNFGYNTDSRKALETYMLCQNSSKKIRSILGNTLTVEIGELVQEY